MQTIAEWLYKKNFVYYELDDRVYTLRPTGKEKPPFLTSFSVSDLDAFGLGFCASKPSPPNPRPAVPSGSLSQTHCHLASPTL